MDICQYCKKKSKATGELDFKELEHLGHNCSQVVFHKDDKIMLENALSYNIAYIKDRLVKVHAKGPEKDQILKIVKGPSYLGIPTTIGQKSINILQRLYLKPMYVLLVLMFFKTFLIQNGNFAYEI